jgi:hypothetical protein
MSGGRSYAVATESLGLPYRKSFGSSRSNAAILVILGARDIESSPAGAACLLPQSQGFALFLKGSLFGLCGSARLL